jgi:hypothetical protein
LNLATRQICFMPIAWLDPDMDCARAQAALASIGIQHNLIHLGP